MGVVHSFISSLFILHATNLLDIVFWQRWPLLNRFGKTSKQLFNQINVPLNQVIYFFKVEAAVNYKAGDKFYKKSSYMEYLVLNIDQFVDDGRRQEMARSQSRIIRILGTSFPCAGRFLGNYILILYMMTKLIYIINTFIQVSLISVFLGQSFWSYGMTYISNLVAGRGWYVSNSKYFPSNYSLFIMASLSFKIHFDIKKLQCNKYEISFSSQIYNVISGY